MAFNPKKVNPISAEEFWLRMDGRTPVAAARILGLPASTVSGWAKIGGAGVAERHLELVRSRFPIRDEDPLDAAYRLGYNEALLDVKKAAQDSMKARQEERAEARAEALVAHHRQAVAS